MSHDHGWRAACHMTIWILKFQFEIHEVARGVTAMVVGSGALLGRFSPSIKVEKYSAPAHEQPAPRFFDAFVLHNDIIDERQ